MADINQKEMVDFVKSAVSEEWGYVYSGQGEVYTKELAEKWAKIQRAGKSASYFLNDCKKWIGRNVVDCSGLLIEAIRTKISDYDDMSSWAFRSEAVERGSISDLPDIPGLAVWKSGHIGLYVGAGKVVEAAGTKIGVVETPLWSPAGGSPWKEWLQLRDVEYENPPGDRAIENGAFTLKRLLKLKDKWMRGSDVRDVQNQLLGFGFYIGGTGADGIYGPRTTNGVKQFQSKRGLVQDGIVGEKTTAALGGLWKG